MLAYVPVAFAAYRPLKAHLRWTLQCLVGFANASGFCFPSVRKLADVTGLSKSTVARHLIEREKARVPRNTVDWDTLQADDFRTRGEPWTTR